ncbi:peptidylprolyl isomerase [Desulfallas thermosapovorans]|uniref:Peptidyl-prolyl cis-trans isomerase C n=1 Tax=Desulfallas thermosapovorans DSM 6562 TaxID=1121431 RepID=A0A5S4ZW07_9FIRM|nr:peptidylprolyl isomerase [Desulfallas thermosapovorans]TYO96965.1 peptidyl-prolyl cis-trans isomerase C [Desulfallas thermosapovorans DSM 6562]
MRRNTIILLSLTLSLALVFLGGCGSNVVATVNGENITSQELDEAVATQMDTLAQQGFVLEGEQAREMEKMLQQDVLNQLIDQRLVLAEVERLGLMPTDKEVQEEIATLKEQLDSEGEFKKFLAAYGINEPKLGDFMKEQLAVNKLYEKISSEVPQPTETEISDYYAKNSAQYTDPEQRQVSHILIGVGDYSNGKNRSEMDAKVLALQIVDKVASGADFAQLAREYSDDLGSKDNGGQYPAFSKGSGFAEEFENAAFALQEGKYTVEPVKTTFGYHIIRLDKLIPAKTYTLDEVKDQIITSLRNERVNQKVAEYMQELRDNADIVNKLAEQPAEQQSGTEPENQSTKK